MTRPNGKKHLQNQQVSQRREVVVQQPEEDTRPKCLQHQKVDHVVAQKRHEMGHAARKAMFGA